VVVVLRERGAGRRFLFASVALLPVLAGTGVARAMFELSAPEQLWTTGYGRALLVKTGLTLLALPLVWQALRLAAHGRARLAGLALGFDVAGARDRGSRRGTPCRPGCYRAVVPLAGPPRRVTLTFAPPGRPLARVPFPLPRQWPPRPVPGVVRRAAAVFRAL